MGSVRKLKYKSGRNGWQARWRDLAGVARAKNFTRKADAERYLVALESDKLRGRYADPRLGRTRLADWLTEWQSSRTNLSPATRLRDDASIRNHLVPSLGNVPIGQIQPVHVAQWVEFAVIDGTNGAWRLTAASSGRYFELSADGCFGSDPSRWLT